MSGTDSHTESAFDQLERLTNLLAQAEALIVVAECDGLDLRDDLKRGYMQALHSIVAEARAVAGRLTAEAVA